MGPEILIVGDRAHRGELVPRVQDLGYSVSPVRERELLLQVARSPGPAAVIVCLGETDAHALVRKLRQSPEGSAVPVLLYGRLHGENRDLASVLELGADRFLEAPVADAELVAALAELAGPPDSGHVAGPPPEKPAAGSAPGRDPVLGKLHRTLEVLAARLESRDEVGDGLGDGIDLEAMGLDAVPDVDPEHDSGELELLPETTQRLPPRAAVRGSASDAVADRRWGPRRELTFSRSEEISPGPPGPGRDANSERTAPIATAAREDVRKERSLRWQRTAAAGARGRAGAPEPGDAAPAQFEEPWPERHVLQDTRVVAPTGRVRRDEESEGRSGARPGGLEAAGRVRRDEESEGRSGARPGGIEGAGRVRRDEESEGRSGARPGGLEAAGRVRRDEESEGRSGARFGGVEAIGRSARLRGGEEPTPTSRTERFEPAEARRGEGEPWGAATTRIAGPASGSPRSVERGASARTGGLTAAERGARGLNDEAPRGWARLSLRTGESAGAPAANGEPGLPPLGSPRSRGETDAPALLAELRRERFTGCVQVTGREAPERRLWWSEGQVIGGSSAAMEESVLGRLTARGLIAAAQLELAARWSTGDPRRDLERLVQAGLIKPQEMQEALREPVRRIVEQIAEAGAIAWALHPDEAPAVQVELGVPLAALIAGGVRRGTPLAQLREAVGDGRRPRVSFTGPEALAAELRWPEVTAIVGRFDGRTSVGELVAEAIADEADVRAAIHVLGLLGHLAPEIADPEATLTAVDRRRVRERLRLARDNDYFALLGVARSATRAEVLRAHADLGATFREGLEPTSRVELAAEVEELLAALDEARDVLVDEALRTAYLGQLAARAGAKEAR